MAVCAVVGALLVAVVAHGLDGGKYQHVWVAQEMVGGDRGGELRQQIDDDSVTLESDGGVWSGSVDYSDRLGIMEASGRLSAQLADISLTLTGEDIVAGQTGGGTFAGTIRLRTYDVSAIEDAFSDEALGDPAADVTYDVSGHWGAQWSGESLVGEILYESASPQGERIQNARTEAARFNRASLASSDALGDPQTFSFAEEVPPVDQPDDDGSPDQDGPGAEDDSPSFWDYVRAGATGREQAQMPAPALAARAARELLDAAPADATPMPDGALAIDIHVSGAYLDAKNRAAGLLDDDGPTGVLIDAASIWEENREATAEPVAPADANRLEFYGVRIMDALQNRDDAGLQEEIAGGERLISEVKLVLDAPGAPSGDAPLMKLWSHAARAVVWGPGLEDVLPSTRAAAEAVLEAPIPQSGPLADAVLVWADAPDAPLEARAVVEFAAEPSADATASPDGDGPVARVLSRHGTQDDPPSLVAVLASGESLVLAPSGWPALVAPDGRLLWRAGSGGDFALTDGALRGWAFRTERMWLVDVLRMGRIVDVYELE